jgi:uncharacterized protein YbbC (DUF1343 family)
VDAGSHLFALMRGALRLSPFKNLFPLLVPVLALLGCSAAQPAAAQRGVAQPLFTPPPGILIPRDAPGPRILLGIDVLEAEGFAALKGKRIGLLTHPAGTNRRGERTLDVLRRAPEVKLVALYAVEHGIHNEHPAEKRFPDQIDPRTGLMVYSLYNPPVTKPRADQLKGIDALVFDMQDIGTRSYTFISAMKQAMHACFEHGKEFIVLDRPNPLGGLKVSGPPLDAAWRSYVGAFRIPYVHGLTAGELARMAKEAPEPPGALAIPEPIRAAGKLTIVTMRGWTRNMRWPETGLTFVPTSTRIRDFAAVQGYPMTGLGCIVGGFSHGVGDQHPFRGIHHPRVPLEVLERELRALNLPGLQFRRVSVPHARTGQPALGIYIEITDYEEWQPCDLNFWLMKLACRIDPKNPFAALLDPKNPKRREFLVHVGSEAFLNDIAARGAQVDIDGWLRQWREQARIYQEQSRRYWLYR